MPSVLDRPPTSHPRPRRRRILSENEDTRSVQAGLLLTMVLWPLIVWLLGAALTRMGNTHVAGTVSEVSKPVFNIEIVPEDYPIPQQQPEPPPPDRFVETNPDAPENTPDQTRNFAAQNQQVAQEKPTPDGKSDTPELEGKKDMDVSQIVSGQLRAPELPPPPPAPPPSPEVRESQAAASARREQNPLPGEEKIQGDNPDGIGTSASKETDNAAAIPDRIEGQKDAPLFSGAPAVAQARIDPQRPQPRPRIDRNVRPAILAENKLGTSNVGPIAIDARWSQYGQYLQKLLETVQVQWERILRDSRVYPPSGSTVTVKFRLEATEGAVAEILHSESTAGTQAERACISAITERAPYGKWTEDMIAVLGQSQEMTFTFYYQ